MVLDKKKSELKRVIARERFNHEKKEMSFIHLEGSSDMRFFSKYILARKLSVPENTRCVYTGGKKDAIDEHKKALEEGFRIVTIVDMDYDYDEEEIFGIDNIFTTKCACTLLTMQFQESIGPGMLTESLSEENLFQFLDKYPGLDKIQALNKVVDLTFTRLNKDYNYGKKNITNWKRQEKRLKAEGVVKPINDHDLVTYISENINPDASVDDVRKHKRKIESELFHRALNDNNQSINWLMSKVLEKF